MFWESFILQITSSVTKSIKSIGIDNSSAIVSFFQRSSCFFPFFFIDLEKSKDISKEIDGATEKLKKQLAIEKTMKIQAVNKLAEIMNRKDLARDNSKKRKATSDDLRKKEKECRKLHQELGAVSTFSTRKVSVIRPRCTRGCLSPPPATQQKV